MNKVKVTSLIAALAAVIAAVVLGVWLFPRTPEQGAGVHAAADMAAVEDSDTVTENVTVSAQYRNAVDITDNVFNSFDNNVRWNGGAVNEVYVTIPSGDGSEVEIGVSDFPVTVDTTYSVTVEEITGMDNGRLYFLFYRLTNGEPSSYPFAAFCPFYDVNSAEYSSVYFTAKSDYIRLRLVYRNFNPDGTDSEICLKSPVIVEDSGAEELSSVSIVYKTAVNGTNGYDFKMKRADLMPGNFWDRCMGDQIDQPYIYFPMVVGYRFSSYKLTRGSNGLISRMVAEYNSVEYSIFVDNDDSGRYSNCIGAVPEGAALAGYLPEISPPVGKHFVKWQLKDGSDMPTYCMQDELYIRAVFEWNTYSVVFNYLAADGTETSETVTYTHGHKFSELAVSVPALADKHFTAWHTAAGEVVTGDTVVTGAMSVTGQYETNIYTVTFRYLDANGAIATKTVDAPHGTRLVDILPDLPAVPGKIFTGWNVDPAATVTASVSYTLAIGEDGTVTPVENAEIKPLSWWDVMINGINSCGTPWNVLIYVGFCGVIGGMIFYIIYLIVRRGRGRRR